MNYARYFLLAVSVLFLGLNFVNYNIIEDNSVRTETDRFDSSLLVLNSLNKLEAYVDSVARSKNIALGSLDYAIEAKDLIALRFYHKYASQNLNENWIAAVSQKITGLYLSSKITADDILSRPYGYCGQQNTVLMELLQRKKLDCRVIYLPSHFVIQSKIDGAWQFFDSNGEPDFPKDRRADMNWLTNKDTLAAYYKKDLDWVKGTFGDPVVFKYGKVNEKQGVNAQLFQRITKWLSRIAFVFPLLGFVYLNRKTKSRCNQPYQVNYPFQERLSLP